MPLVMNRPEDFVTVVEVSESKKLKTGDDFVTVVSVGDQLQQQPTSSIAKSEEVIVEAIVIYRLPGERLGMALKFEGGISASQAIDRVFVQNVNEGGPASKASGHLLGRLLEGDEIVEIEGMPVSGMTRINCVNCLREAPVCINMTVKRYPSSHQLSNGKQSVSKNSCNGFTPDQNRLLHESNGRIGNKCNKKGPPPPVPPRLSTTTLSSVANSSIITQGNCNSNAYKQEAASSPVPESKELGSPHSAKNKCGNNSPSSTGRPKRSPPPLPPRRPSVPPPSAPSNKSSPKSQSNGTSAAIPSPASSSNHANQISMMSDNLKSSDTKLEKTKLPSSVSSLESPMNKSVKPSSSPSPTTATTSPTSSLGVSSNHANGNNNHYNVSQSNKEHLQHHPHQSPVTSSPSSSDFNIDLFAPPDFAVYVESESDDTGSSVSTVIERLSPSKAALFRAPNSDMRNNRGLRTPTIDIEDVLGPFEQLERELDHKEALQRFMDDTAAAMNGEAHGKVNSYSEVIPELLDPHTVNLDDYDDIQSVSMTYTINDATTAKESPKSQRSKMPAQNSNNSKSPSSAPLVLSATTKFQSSNTNNATNLPYGKQVANSNPTNTTKKSGRKDPAVNNATPRVVTRNTVASGTKTNHNSDSHGDSNNHHVDNKRNKIKHSSTRSVTNPRPESSTQLFVNNGGSSCATKAEPLTTATTLPRKSALKSSGNFQSKYNSVDNLNNKSLSSSTAASTPTTTPRIRPGILKKTSSTSSGINSITSASFASQTNNNRQNNILGNMKQHSSCSSSGQPLQMKGESASSKNRSSSSHTNGQQILSTTTSRENTNNSLIPKLDFAKGCSPTTILQSNLPSRKYHSTGNLAFGVDFEGKPSLIPRPVSTKVVTFAPNLVQTVPHPKDLEDTSDEEDDDEVQEKEAENIYLENPFASSCPSSSSYSNEILDNEVEVMDIDKEIPLFPIVDETATKNGPKANNPDNEDDDGHQNIDDEIEGMQRKEQQVIDSSQFPINRSQVVATADQEGRKEPECPHSNNQDHQIIESVLDPCHFAATPLDISPQNQDGSNYGRESLSKSEDITEEEHDYKGTAPLLIDSDVKPYCHGTLLQLTGDSAISEETNQRDLLHEELNQQDIIELILNSNKTCQVPSTPLRVEANVKIDRSLSQDSGITVSPDGVIQTSSTSSSSFTSESLTEKLVNSSVNINLKPLSSPSSSPTSSTQQSTNNRLFFNDSGQFSPNEPSVNNDNIKSSIPSNTVLSASSSPTKEVMTNVLTHESIIENITCHVKEGSMTDTEEISHTELSSLSSFEDNNVTVNNIEESRMDNPGVEYDFPLTSVRERIALFQKHFSEQNIPLSLKTAKGSSSILSSTPRNNGSTTDKNRWMSRSIDSKLFASTDTSQTLMTPKLISDTSPSVHSSSWSIATHHLRSSDLGSSSSTSENYSSGEIFSSFHKNNTERTASSLALSSQHSSLSSSPNKSYVLSVLQPSYKRFTSYDPLVRTTSNGCLPRLTTPSPTNAASPPDALASLLQTRRQNTTKLKGLVIPDSRQESSSLTTHSLKQTASSKTIPTIKSSEMVLNKSDDLILQSQTMTQQPPSSLTQKSFTSVSSSLFQSFESLKNTIPKYSPAFKRRALEVPKPSRMSSPSNSCSSHSNTSDPMSRINSLPLGSRNFSLKFPEDNEQQDIINSSNSSQVASKNPSSNCLHIETKFSPSLTSCCSSVDQVDHLLDSTSSNSSNHSDDSGLLADASSQSSSSSLLVSTISDSKKELNSNACSPWSTVNHQGNSACSFSSHLSVKSLSASNYLDASESEEVSTASVAAESDLEEGLSEHFRSLSLKWKQRVMQHQQSQQEATIVGKVSKHLCPVVRSRVNSQIQKDSQDPALPLLNSLQNSIMRNSDEMKNVSIFEEQVSSNKISENDRKFDSSLHFRVSSVDSTSSDSGTSTLSPSTHEALPPVVPFTSISNSITNLRDSQTNLRDSQYGSVTSLASSTSLISPQDLQQLIDEANQSLDSESSSYNHNPQVILLNRDSSSTGSTGIILAGGADHETKEISVHKIISGSLADRDGRMRRGDRVISINGKIIKGYTRQAALDILRSPRPQVVIVISRPTDEQLLAQQTRLTSNYAFGSRSDLSNVKVNGTSPSELGVINDQSLENSTPKNYKTLIVTLHKDGAGLGFILEGGKDYPLCPGGKPLSIKKIFRGGLAEKEGTLMAGDEILSVNGDSVANMTRTEAWNFLKKLPDVPVKLAIRRVDYGY